MKQPYLPFLISVGQAGAFSLSMTYDKAFDTKERFKLWIKHSPYTIYPKIKNLVAQNWPDEQGEDVWLPTTGIMNDPYDYVVEFIYYENDGMATQNIQDFINLIKGKWLKIYDTYSGLGRQGVYVQEFDKEPEFKRRRMPDGSIRDYVYFKVIFRVNDPRTDIVLTLNA